MPKPRTLTVNARVSWRHGQGRMTGRITSLTTRDGTEVVGPVPSHSHHRAHLETDNGKTFTRAVSLLTPEDSQE